ncbi:MAG: response regulator [Prolixibacteraceae bacterium]|nr:response regulator [Prolixibacteraceae bacterium]
MHRIRIVFLLFAFLLNSYSWAGNYQFFDNYKLSNGPNSVRFITQDSMGLMWMGTNNGLYSFDGYKSYPHYSPNTYSNPINCGLLYNSTHLLLGSESGLVFYNIQKERYEAFFTPFTNDVRALVKTNDELWIGCANGLFVYNFLSGEMIELMDGSNNGKKHGMVYALLKDEGYLYLGSNDQFGRYKMKTKHFEALGYPADSDNFFITSLLKDEIRNCIWIGRGFNLLRYSPAGDQLENMGNFSVVKSMATDHENNIIMGTDDGLDVFSEKEITHVVHDSREANSLANNIVWCVFKDKADNIWLGTDNGVSVSPRHRRFNTVPIYKITGSGEGNQFNVIFRDSKQNYWLGGTNGLIKSSKILEKDAQTRWFKMGEDENYIAHNHIRDVFEDSDSIIWVATDYGLNRYDSRQKRFIRYSIFSTDKMRNANWTYDLLEDSLKRIWIASFKDGIFVIDKEKLLQPGTAYIADKQFSKSNGLSGNNVDFMVFDRAGDVWALIHHTTIDVINIRTNEVSNFPINNYTDHVPTFLMNDAEGNIWVGYRNGVLCIDEQKTVHTIRLKGANYADVLSMSELDNSIWVSTTDGLWMIDKTSFETRRIAQSNQVFTSMYYDNDTKCLMFGGTDGITLLNPDQKNNSKPENIIISAIYVNNQKFNNESDSSAVRFIKQIELDYTQNNIRIELSDLSYSKEMKGQFIYKLNEEEKWTTLTSGENSIQLNKINPGTYHLSIGMMSHEDEVISLTRDFAIKITPPWYGSLLAKLIYLTLSITLIWWVFYFIISKKLLEYERLEKEKNLEQARLKIEFFTDIAHEFKTPLSLIIAPLTRFIQGTRNENDRNALVMVHQNAMKLNSLIHQAIDYYRDDSKVNIGLLLSKVELVEFARSIFMTYKEGMKDRKIEFIFNTNTEQLFLNIDLVKIESVFNNLLSNACRFTNEGDSIIFSIEHDTQDNTVEIKISDTGIGIPGQDIPYIFQRFYQSQENQRANEGTGIGLFIVKNYIELHGGEVNVLSKMGEGTTFSVCLPILESNIENQPDVKLNPHQSTDKQLIVIVEDNAAIAEFIYNTFIGEYRCVVAHNGKTGLKACMELKPDLIISDVVMPVMDGLEMADRLKKNISTATIPLVFLTAKDDKATELKSIELNIEAFIAKPFDSTILHSRVKQILENRKILEKKARIEHISSPKIEKTASLDEKFLAKITKIIEDKIADPGLNVNLLCELAEISPKQLYRKIKQLTGLTAIEYIKTIRLKKAAMFLSNKNFTIAEVMYMVGFSNHSYFAKCFHAKFGKTPREYVEMQKTEPGVN